MSSTIRALVLLRAKGLLEKLFPALTPEKLAPKEKLKKGEVQLRSPSDDSPIEQLLFAHSLICHDCLRELIRDGAAGTVCKACQADPARENILGGPLKELLGVKELDPRFLISSFDYGAFHYNRRRCVRVVLEEIGLDRVRRDQEAASTREAEKLVSKLEKLITPQRPEVLEEKYLRRLSPGAPKELKERVAAARFYIRAQSAHKKKIVMSQRGVFLSEFCSRFKTKEELMQALEVHGAPQEIARRAQILFVPARNGN
jgi:hypothetical protein